ncbi:hypothetical protein HKD37_06G016576 [Glycine soja]|nr:hypothetical protein JHK87_015950 [Glycine soja]KAH1246755.1 hypothetical protein GmHk_06G016780 [Glycine max]
MENDCQQLKTVCKEVGLWSKNGGAIVAHDNNHTHWNKPYPGALKINVNAGIVIQDELRRFLKAKTITSHGNIKPKEAEVWALSQALIWMTNMELQNVTFEVDCKAVMDGFNSNQQGIPKFYFLISSCNILLYNYPNSRVSLVQRQAYQVAHSLARASRLHASNQVFKRIPNCILGLVLNETQ